MYHIAVLAGQCEVVVAADSAADEDHIYLQVDGSSIEGAVPIGYYADPHSGRQMVLLKIRKRVRRGCIDVGVLVLLLVAVLHNCILAAEAAVRNVFASAVREATATSASCSPHTPGVVTYRSWKLCLATWHSSIYARVVSRSSRLLSLCPILWLLARRIRRRRLLPLISRRWCRIALCLVSLYQRSIEQEHSPPAGCCCGCCPP
jgi:hypothetical protein